MPSDDLSYYGAYTEEDCRYHVVLNVSTLPLTIFQNSPIFQNSE